MKRFIFTAMVLFLATGMAYAEGDCWIKKNYPLAISEAILDDFIKMIQAEDYTAAQKMVDRRQVLITSADIKAYMHDIHVFGHDEIRLPGSTRIWWVPSRAVSLEKPE